MPEGPEHYKAAQYINKHCGEKIFTGKIIKSAVNLKNPEISFNVNRYTVHATSRGKELMLRLTEWLPRNKSSLKCNVEHQIEVNEKKDQIKNENENDAFETFKADAKNYVIIFQFGMSGQFLFTKHEDMHKHSHLMFYTDETEPMVLSYVDVRRYTMLCNVI